MPHKLGTPSSETLLQRFLTYQKRLRPALVIVILVLVGLSAFVTEPMVKVSILISVCFMIIFIVNDTLSFVTNRFTQLETALADLRQPRPQEFKDFYAARASVLDAIMAEASEKKEVDIKILALAAYFSSEFIERNLAEILGVARKVKLEIAVTCDAILSEHQQQEWLHRLIQTRKRIENIRKQGFLRKRSTKASCPRKCSSTTTCRTGTAYSSTSLSILWVGRNGILA